MHLEKSRCFFSFYDIFCEYVIECIEEGVMLIAKNQKGLLVSALENGLNREETYRCPGCQGIVLLRQGKVICPHFAHKSLQDCQFFSENEDRKSVV